MHKRFGVLVAAAMAAALSGCDSVGEGNGLLRLELVPVRAEGTRGEADYMAVSYECIPETVNLIGRFTNGSSGRFNSRANWSSSDEGVVRVSQGDIAIPGLPSSNFERGVLVPVAPGSATITAEYVGLSVSIPVEVRSPDSVQLTRGDLTMAPLTIEGFGMEAVIDGNAETVTGLALWSLSDESGDFVRVSSTGTVQALQVTTAPIELTGRLPLCADADYAQSTTVEGAKTVSLNVRAVESIAIESEFTSGNSLDGNIDHDLMLGTTEFFTATARLEGGATQVLTNQANLSFLATDAVDDVTVATFLGSPRGLLLGAAVETGSDSSTTLVTARLGAADDPLVFESAPVTVNVRNFPLTAFSIEPLTASIEALSTQQYTATGTFDSGSGDVSQLITRQVTWTSSDTGAVILSTGAASSFAGLASSIALETEPQNITISGTAQINGTATTLDAALTVNPIPQCRDSFDNDGDGLIDFGTDADNDPGCSSADDVDESDA